MDKIGELARGNQQQTNMERWEKAISENKFKKEERSDVMDRGQRAAKANTENTVQSVREQMECCQTCEARRYVDQSDDSAVSFQTPTHIAPEQSFAAVMSHEMEHVQNESFRAKVEDREVIKSSVSIHYAQCPECGVRYAAGGETKTVTRARERPEDDVQTLAVLMGRKNRRGEGTDGVLMDSKI